MEETSVLGPYLKVLGLNLIFYAVMVIGINAVNGGENINMITGEMWVAIGTGVASAITAVGMIVTERVKSNKSIKTLDKKVGDVKENIDSVKENIISVKESTKDTKKNVNCVKEDITSVRENVKDIKSGVESTKDKLVTDVEIPVKNILANSKKTVDGVEYLVNEQKIRNRIKKENENKSTERLIIASAEKLVEEKNAIIEEKNVLIDYLKKAKQENDRLKKRNAELENSVSKLSESLEIAQEKLSEMEKVNKNYGNILRVENDENEIEDHEPEL